MATIEQLKQVILNKIQDLVNRIDDPSAVERLSQSLLNLFNDPSTNLNQLTNNLDANFYQIKNVANPVDRHDAATKDYVDDAIGSGVQNRFTDDVNANSYKIRNLGEPVVSTDAATKGYVDTADQNIMSQITNTIEPEITAHENDHSNPHQVTLEQARSVNNQLAGDIDANGNLVKNLGVPAGDNDAVRKTDLTTHTDDNNNPHQVTLEQARSVNNQLAGDINANGNLVKNLGTPTDNDDAVRKTDLENLTGVADSLILNKLKNVDGNGSGLDADLLRGLPADFTNNKAANGYTKLPNGLIIQWGWFGGGAYSGDIYFPIAFPHAVLTWSANAYDAGFNSILAINSINSTKFHWGSRNANNNLENTSFYWLAIGY